MQTITPQHYRQKILPLQRKAFELERRYKFDLGSDFHTLSSHAVENVLQAAREWKYKAPINRNGSKARYFFEYLQRIIQPRNIEGFF